MLPSRLVVTLLTMQILQVLCAPKRSITVFSLLVSLHEIALSLVVAICIAVLLELIERSCVLDAPTKCALVVRHGEVVEMLSFRCVQMWIQHFAQSTGGRAGFSVVTAFGRLVGGRVTGSNT